jgi:Na+:H+ antiporter, NhaA family
MAILTPPVDPARDHTQGAADAPLTLLEFGDYECPSCRKAFPVVQRVKQHFGSKLRFVFRHFPLTDLHPYALQAALAAEAAGSAGKFWEMHEALFTYPDRLTKENLRTLSAAIGIEPALLQNAWDHNPYKNRLREDHLSGERSGLSGTPTFFLNGVRHEDIWDEDVLIEALEFTESQQKIGASVTNA